VSHSSVAWASIHGLSIAQRFAALLADAGEHTHLP
jgi:hypothetical protein